MIQLDEKKIEVIVGEVLDRIQKTNKTLSSPENKDKKIISDNSNVAFPNVNLLKKYGIFPDIDSAVKAATKAFEDLKRKPLELRYKIISAIRNQARKYLEEMSYRAVKESKYGRVEDKIEKNRLAIEKTPGPEILKPIAFSDDDGLSLLERAPYGVIGAITPVTNITETLLCNAIGMLSAGNTVVFNVHPNAKETSSWAISILNEAIISSGGPQNCLCGIDEPTIQSAQQLMKHPGIRMLVITGGPAVVAEAMKSGKKAIAAGPGNPPVVVDETAHLDIAARGIIKGASLDNNLICLDEKVIIAVNDIADKLKKELKRHGAVELNHNQMDRLAAKALEGGKPHRDFVGRNAGVILDAIGLGANPDLRLAFGEVEEEHIWVQEEQLMPIIPLVRASDAESAIEMAYRVEHQNFHTAVMYSTNIEHLDKMAKRCNCTVFVKNSISVAGIGFGGAGYCSYTIASPTGEGITTALSFSRERRCTLKDYFRIV